MKIVVIGAGSVGKTLVNMLSSEKHNVSLIELDAAKAKEAANESDALVIQGDATDISVLKDAGIEKANALVAVTEDDKTNLMVSEIAKSMETERIIARVNTPENEQLFIKLGITSVVPVVGITVAAIDKLLKGGDIKLIAEMGKGQVEVIESKLTEKSELVGNPAVIRNAIIGSIYSDGEIMLPDKKTILKKGDVLTIITKSDNVKNINRLVGGDTGD